MTLQPYVRACIGSEAFLPRNQLAAFQLPESEAPLLKVLIAEDNLILADLLEDFLISQSYRVCGLARTVDEAVILADLHKPDLAVLDFRLADGEQGSAIRPLLKDKISMGILYASGDRLNTILTRADGDAYIQKPYGLYDVVRALEIVRSIKTGHPISPSLFPKGFYLLEDFNDKDRKAA